MKISFNTMRFVFILFFLGVYQTQAAEYTYWASINLPGWNYEAVNTAVAFPPEKWHPEEAYLYVSWNSIKNWSAVGRQYQFPTRTVSGKSILSSVQIKSEDDVYVVNMEVIDPVTWRYIALAKRKVRGTGKVDTILFPTFTIPSKPVYFRVSNVHPSDPILGAYGAAVFISSMQFKATY